MIICWISFTTILYCIAKYWKILNVTITWHWNIATVKKTGLTIWIGEHTYEPVSFINCECDQLPYTLSYKHKSHNYFRLTGVK